MRLTSRLFASFTIAVLLGIAGTVVTCIVVLNEMLVKQANWRLESVSGVVLGELAGAVEELRGNGDVAQPGPLENRRRQSFLSIQRLALRESVEVALFAQNGRLLNTKDQADTSDPNPVDTQSHLSDISIWGPSVLVDQQLRSKADFRNGPGSGRSFLRISFFEPWKWYVVVWIPDFEVWKPQSGFLVVVLAFVPVALVIALTASLLLGRNIVRRIEGTLSFLKRFKTEGITVPMPPEGNSNDEIEELRIGINDMAQSRVEAERRLSVANEELSRLNERLHRLNLELENRVRERTNQLIETEKLAYLGGLVAGISHEVNTPIGTSFTAATFMQDRLKQLQNSYKSGAIERSEFERTLNDLIESSGAIQLNLERAAQLLQGFKQIAADQIVDEVRSIELSEYFQQIHVSLKPRLKRTPFELLFDCQLGLSLKTSPGALSQVITNLVENAIVHAFEGRERGTVDISAGFIDGGDRVRIKCADDGVGIKPDVLPRIFHPFFTTKRGTGGTGLGLHIVYNIVTSRLGGTITVQSELGKGTVFTVDLPMDVEKND